jgi:hypothetical protein
MTDENHDEEDELSASIEARSTAPQSEYTARRVLVGAVIALVGLAVTFGVPLAMLL